MRRPQTVLAALPASLLLVAACGSPVPSTPRTAPPSPAPAATPMASPSLSPTAAPPAVPSVDWAPGPDQPSFEGAIAQSPFAAPGTGMHDVIALDDGTWLAVGADARGVAVWRSADGLTWEREPDQASLDQSWMRSVIRTPDGYLAVGSTGWWRAAAWRSDDGLAWTPVSAGQAFEFRGAGMYVIEDVIRTRKGYVAVGFLSGDGELRPAATWTSVDGTAWQRTPDEALALWGQDELRAVASDGRQVVAVGTYIAVSADGRRWSRPIDVAETESLGYDLDDIVHVPSLGSFFAVGSIGAEESARAVVLRSDDGRSWTRAMLDPPPGGRLSAVASDGSTVVAGGTAGFWRTTDGSTWTRAAGPGGHVRAIAARPDRWVAVGSTDEAEDVFASAAVVWASPPVTGVPAATRSPAPVVEGTFSVLSPLPEPAAPVLVELGDGSLLALGGDRTQTRVVRLLPGSAAWAPQARAPWPEGSSISAAVGTDGVAYVVTADASTEDGDVSLFRYDPATGAWKRRAAPPDRTLQEPPPLAAGPDGRVYALGQHGSRVVLAYDPATDRWERRKPMPFDWYLRAAAVARPAEGDIVLVTTERAWHYDPATDRWRPGGPTPLVGFSFGAVAVGDSGTVALLRQDIQRCDLGLSGTRVELYRPDGTWAIGPSLPRPRVGFGAAWSQDLEGIVLAGGSESAAPCSEESTGPFATVELLRLEE